MFTSVLVANRAEIALRVIRTLDTLGIASVAVHTDEDARAPHVTAAGAAVRIPSYLDGAAIVAAARRAGAQAVHPGYGFLAERASFARACADAGVVFIGPSPEAIETMGDKIAARAAVAARGVATVPGLAESGLDDAALLAGARDVGFPLLVKPSAGGGGKGMHRVDDPADLPAALATARREAAAAFGDDTLFLERFVSSPRHIEVQVLADAHGTTVHLGERECSLQRRHQKVVEEAPSPLLTAEQREHLGRAAIATARAVDYVGAGTVEFIVSADAPAEPYFMEMNTRLQVEHPVTEAVTGIDLVAAQVRIAAGEPLGLGQDQVRTVGHAVEARVYAEDPDAGFVPTGGTVLGLSLPTGVRVDHALRDGTHVSSAYDPLLAKVVAHAPTRAEALARLDRALADTHVLGVVTNTAFLRRLLADDDVAAGRMDTGLIDRHRERLTRPPVTAREYAVAALVRWHDVHQRATTDLWHTPSGWRLGGPAPFVVRFGGPAGDPVVVRLTGSPDHAEARVDGACFSLSLHPDAVTVDGLREPLRRHSSDRSVWIGTDDGDRELVTHVAARSSGDDGRAPTLDSPMPGTVVAVLVDDGGHVLAGDAVLAVEAMKMEHVLRAPSAGSLRLHVTTGQTVRRGEQLAQVLPTTGVDGV
ncbi:biotin carboxylase N-terminal domain-containing protein [Georgenia sp. H159]|uniref:ATP-binding protein n=1 Tax=Georgenia sp. H159 TaxID=3076115 RepID=UPI002D797461|nr:biotin carboxylase N-terminal domain-containing protein [Georgenia sp. H159]